MKRKLRDQETRLDHLLSWAKNNRLVSVLMFLAIGVGGVATAVTNGSKIIEIFYKPEHIAIVATRISVNDIASNLHPWELKVKLEPANSQQKLQRITMDFPPDLSRISPTVSPPFEADVGSVLAELNGLLKVPNKELPPGSRFWACNDFVPVVLSIDYLTSGATPRTERLLYAMDFVYLARQCHEDGCFDRYFQVGFKGLRYIRPLGPLEVPRTVVESEIAQKQFRIEPL
jgi:hypothetical protein